MFLSRLIKLFAISLYFRRVSGQTMIADDPEDMEASESSFFHQLTNQLTNQLTSRQDRGNQQVVTGTFRFKRVGEGQLSQSTNARGRGWDIEGCYCDTGTRCSCVGNRNRVRMFVRAPNRGGNPSFPLPPDSMGGLEQESARLQDACLCGGNGCSGSGCGQLNGCVCNSTGACWGAACNARVPVPVGPIVAQPLTQAPFAAQTVPLVQPNIIQNGLQFVRSALQAPFPQGLSINGQQIQQNGQQVATPGDCTCNSNGCTGTGCALLNGCFCVGQNCWGNACQANLLQSQQNANLNANLNAVSGNFLDLFGGGMGPTMETVKGTPVKRVKGVKGRRVRGRGMAGSGKRLTKMKPEVAMALRKKVREMQEGEESQKDEIVTPTDDWSPVSFENDFLPFKTEITRNVISSLPVDLPNTYNSDNNSIDFPVDKESGPVVPLTREQKFAEKLQKSLARFFRSSPTINPRVDDHEYKVFDEETESSMLKSDISEEDDSLMFTEGVLNVNIVSLEDSKD